MQLTKEEAIRRHRMMWNWIADESIRQKRRVERREAFEHFGWGVTKTDFWCCEYVAANNKKCSDCPIAWPKGARCAINDNTPYIKWCFSLGYNDCAKYAKQIEELPERED